MRNIKIVIYFIFLSKLVLAIQPVPVRVESGLCESTTLSQKGSGVLFNEGNAAYVITSEHVVLHSNGEYCHRIYLENGTAIEANLVVAEYGNGLALLKTSQFVSAPSLGEYFPSSITNGLAIEVLGFPHSTALLTRENRGKILIANSTRQPFPLITRVVELTGAHGEFGMSGGPVVGENGQLVGILSHQYLKLVAGGKTVTANFSKDTNVLENGLAAIPGDEAITWVQSILKTTNPKGVLVRDPEEQLIQKEAAYVAGLRFEMIQRAGAGAPVGGGEGAGIGGGEGAGIGGNSQVGIGAIEVSLDLRHGTTLWPMPRLAPWHERTLRELRTRIKTVQIPFLVDKSTGTPAKVSITSLNQFFTSLKSATMNPVTQVESDATSSIKLVREIKALGSVIDAMAKSLLKEELTSAGKVLLQEISLIGVLSTSEDWSLIDIATLESLSSLEKNKNGWEQLFTNYFDRSVTLLEKLNALKGKIKESTY